MTLNKSKFPCLADLVFFQSKRTPPWARHLVDKDQLVSTATASIDACVNAHGRWFPTSGQLAASNLLFIIRSMQRRGDDIGFELARIAQCPECGIAPEKRAAFARKWARRLGAKIPGKVPHRAPVQRREFTL